MEVVGMSIRASVQAVIVLTVVVLASGGGRLPLETAAEAAVGEKVLLDNARVMMIEYVFPAGFTGEEHAAIAPCRSSTPRSVARGQLPVARPIYPLLTSLPDID